MSVDHYQRKIQQLRQELSSLEARRASLLKTEAGYRTAATRALQSISKTTSPSTVRSRTQDAESKQRSADREHDKVVDVRKKIAQKHAEIASAEKALANEEDRASRARARAEQQAQDRERRQAEENQRKQARDTAARDRELASLRGQVRQVGDELSNVRAALARELPPVATVLLLFADPEATLRLDREMRAIHQAVRLSEQRDRVKLEARWATRPSDITQAILDTHPTVVHFSGHGTAASELAFEGEDGDARVIEPADLVGLVRAIGESVRVILYNACWSAAAATAMADRVEVAIGMDAPVTDVGARAFAEGFYRAIGSGQSVAAAFEVGRFELRNSPSPRRNEAEPVMVSRPDTDPEAVFLVAPPSAP